MTVGRKMLFFEEKLFRYGIIFWCSLGIGKCNYLDARTNIIGVFHNCKWFYQFFLYKSRIYRILIFVILCFKAGGDVLIKELKNVVFTMLYIGWYD